MPSLPLPLLHLKYEKAADAYLKSLPPEHHMEAVAQANQRKITLESLDLVHARRPEVQIFNELLIQYPLDPESKKLGQVVPDNMVVIWPEPIKAAGSFNIPFQPVGPFLLLEYVSKHSERKDYEESFVKYEQDLKVPYYLVFYPDNQEMTLYKLKKGKYASVKPNKHGRCPIDKLELEVGLLDGWVRYWHQGELLPLPADLLEQLRETQLSLENERQARLAAESQRDQERQVRLAAESQRDQERQVRLAMEDEVARLKAELEQMRQR
jgi:Uma2 family endonuclease